MENANLKTIGDDFDVFKKMYLNKSEDSKLTEDSFLGLLADLQLLKLFERGIYYIDNNERPSLTVEVFLFTILDNPQFGSSISLHSLENDENSPGVLFALNRGAMLDLIERAVEKYPWVVFTEQAGISELQFKIKPVDPYALF